MPSLMRDFTQHYDAVIRALTGRGLLLGAYDARGRANAMTIGWAGMGASWGVPVWIVMVRPTRYTFDCIEHTQAFSVCVPGPGLQRACQVCGSQSGRDRDKLRDLGLAVEPGTSTHCPVLPACPIVYECSVVHSHDVNPQLLVPEIDRSTYANRDYHRVYWGRIDGLRVDPDAAERLAE